MTRDNVLFTKHNLSGMVLLKCHLRLNQIFLQLNPQLFDEYMKFSLVHHTHENLNVFITFDDSIHSIQCKKSKYSIHLLSNIYHT